MGFGPRGRTPENHGFPPRASPTARRSGAATVERCEEDRMELKLDEGLRGLIDLGKRKGYLTYEQVNEYLPDEAAHSDKLDALLLLLEEQGIELLEESEAEGRDAEASRDEPIDELERDGDLSFLGD